MPQTDILDQLKNIFVERFALDASNIHLNADLEKNLKLDSLDAVDLVMIVNEVFSVRIPIEALENIHTVADLVSYIQRGQ